MEKTELMNNGALVKLRSVPPYVLGDVYAVLPSPPTPRIVLESKAGSEVAVPLPGSKEYQDYRQALADHRVMLQRAAINFTLQYGVIKWKWPDGDWVSQPPDDWTIPAIMAELDLLVGHTKFSDKRLQYIKYALIQTSDDMDIVDAVINGETKPATKEEVEAASVPFDSQTPEDSP